MLLRHFDVLRNWASNEGSQSDHTGMISEVASVIRKFTQPVDMAEDISSEERLSLGPVSNGFFLASSLGEDVCLLYFLFCSNLTFVLF